MSETTSFGTSGTRQNGFAPVERDAALEVQNDREAQQAGAPRRGGDAPPHLYWL